MFNHFILKFLFVLSLVCLAQFSFLGFLVATQIALGSVVVAMLLSVKGDYDDVL